MTTSAQAFHQSALEGLEAMNQAVGNFATVCDKELANKAAYRAMGLDPRDAPTFGWNLSARPSVNQTIINGQPQQPAQTPISGVQTPISGVQTPTTDPGTTQPIVGNGAAAGSTTTPTPPSGVGSFLRYAGAAVVGAATLLGGNYMLQKPTSNTDILNQRLTEISARMNATAVKTPLETEICEELEADPAFKAELVGDLTIIANKIKTHREARLKNGQ